MAYDLKYEEKKSVVSICKTKSMLNRLKSNKCVEWSMTALTSGLDLL